MSRAETPIPAGFTITLDRRLKRIDPATLLGGTPARILRLSAPGIVALREIETGPVTSSSGRALARRLTDGGLAHPRPPAGSVAAVTVVIPVYGRAQQLDRCLAALGHAHPIVVVDDGSPDPASIEAVASRHGARLVVRANNGGPAAARNDGLTVVDTELVAFIDSDCIPTPGWVEALAAHLDDPLVAAAAPRVVPETTNTVMGRYARVRSSLDLGAAPARVAPITGVAYVPTAALVARRSALLEIAREGQVFDRALRFGEDVDLIWRLHRAGWRIRYDPSVRVGHREPADWRALLARRFRYGTSAAPLARRHGDYSVPLVIAPFPALTALAVARRRPALAALGFAATVLSMRHRRAAAGLPADEVVLDALRLTGQMGLGLARYFTQFGLPVLAASALVRGLSGRRLKLPAGSAVLTLAVTPGIVTWAQRRPRIDPLRTVFAQLADDVAYGCGVWVGCGREHTLAPLRPRWVR